MRTFLVTLLALGLIACKESGGGSDVVDAPSVDESGRKIHYYNGYDGVPLGDAPQLPGLVAGLYIKDGTAHGHNGGDVYQVEADLSYKYAHWVNGQSVVEEGDIEWFYTVTKTIMDADNVKHEYFLKLRFVPHTFTPNNCGYALTTYEEAVKETDAATYLYLGDDIHTKGVGFPFDVAYSIANHTPTCL